ncbi:MAG: ligase-associated DNA damage response DEXH box helicase [Pseudomonadota bacterium]
MELPEPFAGWFAARGWALHPHQRVLLSDQMSRRLLIAPTGAGKTMAGFLPSLVDLAADRIGGLHTLYISPLKALAADIGRNLRQPAEEMTLGLRIEDRTGDTSSAIKRRQRTDPPDILLTTPESLALLLSQPEGAHLFRGLRRVVVDEVHALAGSKRGDQLSLGLAQLATLAPNHRVVALSATVDDPQAIADWLAPGRCQIHFADPGPEPDIGMLATRAEPPWAGQGGRYAAAEVMAQIAQNRTTIVFINTRAQAELFFRALWHENADNLPIGLHHGSLARDQRQRVEAAMAAGELRAVVATGSLDLGLDWGDVDLVIQVGAPKNVKRLVQRIGRANHTYDAPSRALIVPANRFEVLECQAALDAVEKHDLDGGALPAGGLDVLCQHLNLSACAGDFDADQKYAEVRQAGAYMSLDRASFDRCLNFCATGGYALSAYPQWHRLIQRADGRWGLRDPRAARRLRMNVGTIVEPEYVKVRMGRGRGGPMLGEVEETFAATLTPGDSFLIGGQVVRYSGTREMTLQVEPAPSREPKIAVFSGTKLAMSTQLAHRVIDWLQEPDRWRVLPSPVRDWLELQTRYSRMPRPDRLLFETFPVGDRFHAVVHTFAGRNANQTLGLLVSQRMEEAGLAPQGFVCSDYGVMFWGLCEVTDPAPLLAGEGLTDTFEDWLAGNTVMKRTFRQVAVVAGLIERNLPGKRKTGKQQTFSSEILYDTLRRFEPDHLLLEITRTEALRGLVDFGRIEEMLSRSAGRIDHVRAERVTPLAAPLMLEAGRIPVRGGSAEDLVLADEAELLARYLPELAGQPAESPQ